MKDTRKPDHYSFIGARILELIVRGRVHTRAKGFEFAHKRIPPAVARIALNLVYLAMLPVLAAGVSPALPAVGRSAPWYVLSNVKFNPCVRTDKVAGLPNFAALGPLEFAALLPGSRTYSNSNGSIVFVDLRRTSVSGPHVDDLKIMGYFRDLVLCDKTSLLLRLSQNLKDDPSSWLDRTLPLVVFDPNKIPETVRTLLGPSGSLLRTEGRQ